LGVVAAMMAAEGELDLDEPVAEFLPDEVVDRVANVSQVTLRQLFQHTAGIPDYLETDGFNDAAEADPTHRWTAAEAMVYAYDLPAEFAPGTDWSYSNSNYLLAGMVLDDILGHSHAIEFRARIFDPLGMDSTFYEHQEAIDGPLVHGYGDEDEDGTLDDWTNRDQGYGLADGGVVSTAVDLAVFIHAVATDEDWLSPAAREEMFATVESEEGEAYGLGVGLTTTASRGLTYGHGGAVTGYVSEMFYNVDRDTTLVVFANGSETDLDEAFESLVDDLLDLAFGR
ncbi:MAG: beta-lactamase family protein, partial [Myxococcales bacterium]|nr:beta-lactamase family protein [Myxococcales bacterium]